MTEQQIIETLATKVMGWTWDFHYGMQAFGWKQEMPYDFYTNWNPLQNISDAWQVVEKFGSMEQFDIRRIKFMGLIPIRIYDITPKAICETALKAVA